jgi:hypothetical protein
MPFFPWPPVEEQLRLLTDPWRMALCPNLRAGLPTAESASGPDPSSEADSADRASAQRLP